MTDENMAILPRKLTRVQFGILLSLYLAYAMVMIRSSWLADDAYITLRTVDNFVHGYGLRWNISERVQTYTHALWMITLIPVYYITQSHYYTPLIISWIFSISCATILLFILPKSFRHAVTNGLIIIFSKAFVDFSTSGLENPLTHLLLVCFFGVWIKAGVETKRSFALGLFAGLLAMNRHDAIILVAPALAWELVSNPTIRKIALIALGMTPILLWEIFALVYYGFPFPNTAYAKLNTAASTHHLLANGWAYIQHTIMFDTLTFSVIFVTALSTIFCGDWRSRMIALGGILYLIYITWAGGDFMSSRFFAAPLVLSLIAFTMIDIKRLAFKEWCMIMCAICLAGMLIRNPTVYVSSKYGKKGDISAHQQYRGVHDERSFYYQHTGILARGGKERWPDHAWRDIAEEVIEKKETVHEFYSIGFLGFFAGRDVHIIDILGLGDPLLARIKHLGVRRDDVSTTTGWGVSVSQGHYERAVPRGYNETIRTGVNVIEDPNLHAYYDHLKLVISGPIWKRARFGAIWNLNRGDYQYLLDAYEDPAGKSGNPK